MLDSTFLHDILRDDPDAVERLHELIDAREPVALSALTVFEVGVGLRGEADAYRAQFVDVVDRLEVIPLGVDEARAALEIQRALYDRGEPIGAVDVLIAGTAARQEDTRVLTRNVGEFERVGAIGVESY